MTKKPVKKKPVKKKRKLKPGKKTAARARKARTQNRKDRLLWIKKNLDKYLAGKITLEEIAKHWKCSEQTIRDDLDEIINIELSKITTKNIVVEHMNNLKNMMLECEILGKTKGVQDSVKLGCIKLRAELQKQILDLLQKTATIEPAVEKKIIEGEVTLSDEASIKEVLEHKRKQKKSVSAGEK